MKIFLVVLIIIGVGFVMHWYHKHFKSPHLNAINIITGAVKSGKTGTMVALGIREYKKRVRKTKLANFFYKLTKKPLLEMPLLYSNIPLACDYVELTQDLLLRKKRFAFGSVVIISELSFVSSKMLYKDAAALEQARNFVKLFGHETHEGVLLTDTQALSDVSKEIRACVTQQIFVNGFSGKLIPFFSICNCREERYQEDGQVINAYTEDIDKSMCKFLVRRKLQEYYDSLCYSILTDSLPVEDQIVNGAELPNLKTNKIVSFEKNYTLTVGGLNEQKEV